MSLRVVHACCCASCEAEATVTVEQRGTVLGRYCPSCWDIIGEILSLTAIMVRQGTPREIAARWASSKVGSS